MKWHLPRKFTGELVPGVFTEGWSLHSFVACTKIPDSQKKCRCFACNYIAQCSHIELLQLGNDGKSPEIQEPRHQQWPCMLTFLRLAVSRIAVLVALLQHGGMLLYKSGWSCIMNKLSSSWWIYLGWWIRKSEGC